MEKFSYFLENNKSEEERLHVPLITAGGSSGPLSVRCGDVSPDGLTAGIAL